MKKLLLLLVVCFITSCSSEAPSYTTHDCVGIPGAGFGECLDMCSRSDSACTLAFYCAEQADQVWLSEPYLECLYDAGNQVVELKEDLCEDFSEDEPLYWECLELATDLAYEGVIV